MTALLAPKAAEDLTPLRDLVTGIGALVSRFAPTDEAILPAIRPLLARLIARDDWLPGDFARPHPDHYQQYLLHADSAGRFSVVSFVWGPGQGTPIHDHRVWGLVGVLRGQERSEHFTQGEDGRLHPAGTTVLERGDIELLSPAQGDIHRVSNGLAHAPSLSIHIYGADIGGLARATYDLDGRQRRFISGYANARLPNLWKRNDLR